jgi:uncharacterized protein
LKRGPSRASPRRDAPGRSGGSSGGGLRRKKGGGRGALVFLFGLAIGAGALYALLRLRPELVPGRGAAPQARDAAPPRGRGSSETGGPAANEAGLPIDFEAVNGNGGGRGVLALVLDDVGYATEPLARLEGLAGPLALAVLPGSPHAKEAIALAGRKRWDLLVHLPMASEGGARPEPGTIGPEMPDAEIVRRVGEAIDAVPGATGINNHQGSRATADRRVLRAVLGVVRERGLYFLDSRTSPASVAEEEARKLGVPFLARDRFLDADGSGSAKAVSEAFEGALREEARKGSCILVAHPRPETLDLLLRRTGREKGPRLVRVSELVE